MYLDILYLEFRGYRGWTYIFQLEEPSHSLWKSNMVTEHPCCSIPSKSAQYTLVSKHGNGTSSIHGGFSSNITNKWSIFHCPVWLPEGKPSIIMWRIPPKNCVASLLHRMIQFTQPVILKTAKQVGRVGAGLPILDYENPRSALIHENMLENRVPYATTQIPSLIIWFFPSQAKNWENPHFQYPILFSIHMKSS